MEESKSQEKEFILKVRMCGLSKLYDMLQEDTIFLLQDFHTEIKS